MKICLSCGSKYPDDYSICYDCDLQMIDSEIAYELKNYGASNPEMLKKYPEECRIVLDYERRQEEHKREIVEKYKSQPVTVRYQHIPRIEKAEPTKNVPKCPTCGSTNIRRISTAEKATGVILFGIFSNKRKYQFECQNPNCKFKW